MLIDGRSFNTDKDIAEYIGVSKSDYSHYKKVRDILSKHDVQLDTKKVHNTNKRPTDLVCDMI